MEQQLHDTHAAVFDLFEYLRGEVEPRRGRGHAAVHLGVHGLVALPVLGLGWALDVRWQRHCSVALHDLVRSEASREAKASQASAHYLHNLRRGVVTELHRAPGLELAPRVHHCQPGPVGLGVDQEYLGLAAALPEAREPRGDHAARVHHEDVARLEQGREIAKPPVTHGTTRPVELEHTTPAAVAQRVLRYRLAREVVIEVGSAEASTHRARRRTSTVARRFGREGCSRSGGMPRVSPCGRAACDAGIPAE